MRLPPRSVRRIAGPLVLSGIALLGLLLFFAVLGWLAQECVPGASHLLQVIQGGKCGWLLHIAWTRPVFSCTEQ